MTGKPGVWEREIGREREIRMPCVKTGSSWDPYLTSLVKNITWKQQEGRKKVCLSQLHQSYVEQKKTCCRVRMFIILQVQPIPQIFSHPSTYKSLNAVQYTVSVTFVKTEAVLVVKHVKILDFCWSRFRPWFKNQRISFLPSKRLEFLVNKGGAHF